MASTRRRFFGMLIGATCPLVLDSITYIATTETIVLIANSKNSSINPFQPNLKVRS